MEIVKLGTASEDTKDNSGIGAQDVPVQDFSRDPPVD
jgi:hypothetical protein